MNANQIINMVMRMVLRKAVNKGVNAGINRMAGGNPGKAGQHQKAVKGAKQAARITRRLNKS
ncbi:hypothetical protein [Thalassovita sp.]|jgi:hypothetical protein|uniref:hypothetical protein n=1 Tax=Thalassovita sp. TaxID=1979401 RepID=UPI003B5CE841